MSGITSRSSRSEVLEAVKQDGWALEDASAALKDDREIVLEAVKKNWVVLWVPAGRATVSPITPLKYASAALQGDREIVLAAATQKGKLLRFAPAALKDDDEVVLGAVKNNGRMLQHASARLRRDVNIVVHAAAQTPFAVQFASPDLHSGGLRAHLQDRREVLLSLKPKFLATILFGAKDAPSPSPSPSQPVTLCDNGGCVLSLLKASPRLPRSFSQQTKQLIWEYHAGSRGEAAAELALVLAASKNAPLPLFPKPSNRAMRGWQRLAQAEGECSVDESRRMPRAARGKLLQYWS